MTIDGNLLARAGSLDPDTFAIESRRTERERLGLDRRFATVLARLSEALSKTLELTDPVFVLPVDDVDLNVRGCVPLLRLLRAVSSPHLVIVLAADIALLGTILSLSFRGDLARIGWPGSTTSRDERVAVDLAASALRKHLPPAQRVILGLVEPWHAFALTPLEPGADSLGTAIGHIELPSDQAALWAPGDFGLPLEEVALTPVVSGGFWPAETRPEAGPLARRLAPFSWPLVLRQPMRRLVDLYLDYQVWAQRNPKRAGAGRDVPDSPLVQHALAMLDQRLGESLDDDARFDIRPWFGQSSSPPEETPFVDVWSWRGWKAEVQSGSLSLVESATLVGSIEIVGSRLRTVFAHPPRSPPSRLPARPSGPRPLRPIHVEFPGLG